MLGCKLCTRLKFGHPLLSIRCLLPQGPGSREQKQIDGMLAGEEDGPAGGLAAQGFGGNPYAALRIPRGADQLLFVFSPSD
jgi:hypothetical protein